MTGTISNSLDLLATPEISAFFGDGRPAWVWDATGRKVLWANAAGLRLIGAADLPSVAREDFTKGGTDRHIARIAESGIAAPTLVQLRLTRGFKSSNTMIHARAITGDGDTPVVLGNGLQVAIGTPGDNVERLRRDGAALAGDAAWAIFDGDGASVAASGGFPAGEAFGDAVSSLLARLLGRAEHRVSAVVDNDGFGKVGVELARLGDSDCFLGVVVDADEIAASAPEHSDDAEESGIAPAAAVLTAGAAVAAAGSLAGESDSAGGAADDVSSPQTADADQTIETGPQAETDAEADVEAEVPAPIADQAPETVEQDQAEAEDGPDDVDGPRERGAADEASGRDADRDTAEIPGMAEANDVNALFGQDHVANAGETASGEPESVEIAQAAASPSDSGNEPADAEDVAAPAADFVFEKQNRPERFVWQMDTQGRFTFVSHEFANAVGPRFADLTNRRWEEIAAAYRLKDRGQVRQAIEKRDTWSGITIDWPVEGTDLRVPVDLAALPAFGGGRTFEGYRGFGVCRTMDAVTDPDAVGMVPIVLDPVAGPPDAGGGAASAETGATVAPPSIVEDENTGPETASPAPAEGLAGARDSDDPVEETPADVSSESAGGSGEDNLVSAVRGGAIGAGAAALWSRALGSQDAESQQQPSEDAAAEPDNVVALHGGDEAAEKEQQLLSKPERKAFRQIAEALGARLEGDDETEAAGAEEAAAKESAKQDAAAKSDTADDGEGPSQNVVPLPSAFASGRPSRIDPTLLDRLPIGVLIARDQAVLYANQPMLDLVDYPDREALDAAGGLDAIVIGPDDSYPEGRGEISDRFVRLRRRDGELVAVAARLHAVPWNDGSALMMSFRAVEENERTITAPAIPAPAGDGAETIAANNRVDELEAILDTATDGVLVLDGEGTILRANDSAEALFGVERSGMIGQTLSHFLAPESRRAASDYLDGLSKNGVASLLNDGREVIGSVAQGGLIPLFMTIGRIGDGAMAKFCAVLRDITQWKKAEEELTTAKRQAEEASSQKSDFLAKISHEIRTPLNAIIGFSEVMMEERFGAVGNERYKEYLNDIHTSGAHIMSLINDLLDLSKIEAGKLELSFEAVAPGDVIQECVALMQPQANRDRIIIRTSLPTSVPKVVADSRSLRQIVLNLLSNAIKFNNSGGQVIVSTALEDSGEVTIRVRDTGVGMSDKDIETALEPFRQLHTSRYGGGTGLGLPLTKALVEANRASFSLSSEVSQGTLVEISFPTTRVLAE